MNILITGGNGFIASYLAAFLKQNHIVLAPGKEQLNCLDKVAVDAFFNTYAIDIVIHTALTGREDLESTDPKYYRDAIKMWYNICDNKHKFKKLIQFGSAYELNLNKHNNNASLIDVLSQFPDSSYGKAKNRIAFSCMGIDKFYTLRLFGNMHYTENDFRFFRKLYKSSEFVILQDRQFDYFNLEDILTVVECIIHNNLHIKDINLVYKEKLTLSEQASLFCDVNKINPVVTVNSTGFNLTGDASNLASLNLPLNGLVKGFEKYHQTKLL